VKKLMTLIVLLSLASCGRSAKTNTVENASVSSMEEANFVQPKIGLHRSMTVDSSLASIYENLTVNPEKNGEVLGDHPFYIMVSENVYPSYSEYQLHFYKKSKIKSVAVFDSRTVTDLSSLALIQLPAIKMTSVKDFYREDFIWGKANIDSPSLDMLNKAYVFNIEVLDQVGRKTYNALSTYLLWFECDSKIVPVKELGYSCATYGLKFHYKLIDYKLNSVD